MSELFLLKAQKNKSGICLQVDTLSVPCLNARTALMEFSIKILADKSLGERQCKVKDTLKSIKEN